MQVQTVDTFFVEICIAGDYDTARQVCREHCHATGLCVTVTRTTFIYTGGEEAGVIVRLVNYPRFPTETPSLWAKAANLSDLLLARLCQHSCLLLTPEKTEWISRRDENKAAK